MGETGDKGLAALQKKRRRRRRILLSLILLIAVFVISAPAWLYAPVLSRFEKKISAATGTSVAARKIRPGPEGSIMISGVTVTGSDSHELARCGNLVVKLPLLETAWRYVTGRQLRIGEVIVEELSLCLSGRGTSPSDAGSEDPAAAAGGDFATLYGNIVSSVCGDSAFSLDIPSVSLPVDLSVERLRLRGFRLTSGETILIDSMDADFSLSSDRGGSSIRLAILRASGSAQSAGIPSLAVRADVLLDDGRLRCRHLSVRTDAGSLNISGVTGVEGEPGGGDLDFTLLLDQVDPVRLLGCFSGSTEPADETTVCGDSIRNLFDGRVDFNRTAAGVNLDLEISGELAGLGEAAARAGFRLDNNGVFSADSLSVAVAGASLNMAGELLPAGETIDIGVTGRMAGVDVGLLPVKFAKGFDTDLSADIRCSLLIRDTLDRVRLEVDRFHGLVNERLIRGGALDVSWLGDTGTEGPAGARVEVRGGWSGAETSGLSVSGALHPEESLDLNFLFTIGENDPLVSLLFPEGENVYGRLGAEGSVTGPWTEPSIELGAELTGFSWRDFRVEAVELRAEGEPFDSEPGGRMFCSLIDAQKGTFQLAEASLELEFENRVLYIDEAWASAYDYCGIFKGSASVEENSVAGSIKEAVFLVPDGRSIHTADLPFSFSHETGGFAAGPADFVFPGGSAVFEVEKAGETGEVGLTAAVVHFPLSMVTFPSLPMLTGQLDLGLDITLDEGAPFRAAAGFSCRNLVAGEVAVDSLHAAALFEDGVLSLERIEAAMCGGTMEGTAEIPVEVALTAARTAAPSCSTYHVDAEWRSVELAALSPVVPASLGLGGITGGNFEIKGDSRAPAEIRGEVSVEQFRIKGTSFECVKAELSPEAPGRTLALLSGISGDHPIAGCGVIPLEINPAVSPYAVMADSVILNLSVQHLDADFLADHIRQVSDIKGRLAFNGDMILGGIHPFYLRGAGVLEKGRVKIANFEDRFKNLEGNIRMNADSWTVDGVKGRLGGGSFRLDGEFETTGMKPVDADLRVKYENLPVTWLRDFDGQADGSLTIKGLKNGEIRGKVFLSRGFLTTEFKKKETRLVPPKKPGFVYDIDVSAPRNLWVKNSEAEVEVGGNISLTNRYGRVGIIGELEILRGKYFVLRRNKFRVVNGTITFLEPDRIDPVLDIEAETTVRERFVDLSGETVTEDVDITFKMEGNLSDLELSFSSDGEPIPEEEALMLIMFHRREIESTADIFETGNILANAGVFGAAILEERFGEILDTVEIEPGAHSIDETLVGVGKYISDNLYIYYSQYLAADPRSHVGFEYRINRFLSVNGTVEEGEMGREYSVDLLLRIEY